MVVLGLALGLLVIAGLAVLIPRTGSLPQRPKNLDAARAAATPEDSAKLVGKWHRPDGGYVLEIRKAGADGTLDAAYFNPSPIHVSKAEAHQDGADLRVQVELHDTGYPGCVYRLRYVPGEDGLRGTYYQAALGETYDVDFVRLKE
jgi:uncharacterized protein (DUF2147 family)